MGAITGGIAEAYYGGVPDHICEVIVLKILLVYIQYIIIGTEDDRNLSYSPDFTFSHESEPTVIQSLTFKNEVCILKIIRYHVL